MKKDDESIAIKSIATAFQFGMAMGFAKKYDEMDKVMEEVKKAIVQGQEPGEMTAEEYRQRMMQAFHNADTDELIALCVLPTEKEFEHLEWLLKNHYKKEPCEDLCKSCDNKGCLFQSGIKRKKCDFYTRKKESCGDWCDVPSDEMTLEQARQAVKDLRKKLAGYLDQKPCDDAISRQAVLEYIEGSEAELGHSSENELVCQYITELPPVTPQNVMEESEEKESCGDCISRQVACDAIRKYKNVISDPDTYDEGFIDGIDVAIAEIGHNVPLVTPQPRTGHWIDITNKHGTVIAVRCNRCKKSPKHGIRSDFCPNCGAKMEGK